MFKFSQANKLKTYLLTTRCLFLSLIILCLDRLIEIPTSNLSLITATILGCYVANLLYSKNLKTLGVILLNVSIFIIYLIIRLLFLNLPESTESLLDLYTLSLHHQTFLIFFSLSCLTTYLTIRFKYYATLESILLLGSLIASFSLHRNYRFDLIKLLNDLAWQFNYSPLLTLVIIATAALIIIISYFFFLHQFASYSSYSSTSNKNHPIKKIIISNRKYLLSSSLVLLFVLMIIVLISRYVYQSIHIEAELAGQNGVGSTTEEGVSPLNFDSALGGSNQPAAIVRLEQDYFDNPFQPMLYLRESALSELKENSLVLASTDYDKDLSRSAPSQTFVRKKMLSEYKRKEIKHSIYLIGSHRQAFALDYPIKIQPVKLTAEQKNFKAGYLVTSLAPIFQFDDFGSSAFGDGSWTKETWGHYLEQHSDLRYGEMASKITKGIPTDYKLQQAKKIIEYLNKNAIYTLTPNHNRKAEEDPTAKFLFGDLRGYCVHFSHAAVYMLRSLGIPSRIGTGYLTDFSQAKDGHILLRMSDRHAWPEVYISPYGWIPFDVTPEQVESHADTPVDQSLLDDLINQISSNPDLLDEDILDDDILEEEDQPNILKAISSKKLIWSLLAFIILIYLRKTYLLAIPIFTNGQNRKLKIYTAQQVLLTDLGLERNRLETKQDYYQRIQQNLPQLDLNLIYDLDKIIYSSQEGMYLNNQDLKNYQLFIKQLSLPQKIMGIINPKSILTGVGIWR